jgi:hypothetical protein
MSTVRRVLVGRQPATQQRHMPWLNESDDLENALNKELLHLVGRHRKRA